MKRVLIFVISCNRPPYDEMIKTSMATWDSAEIENTETYYYCGGGGKSSGRTIMFDGEDDFHLMGHKNLLAFKWALENKQWDYMARVNASCYVHKQNLLNHVQSLPETGVMSGLISDGNFGSGISFPFMWGGSGMIISRDVIQLAVDNGAQWDHSFAEDVAMGTLVQKHGIVLDGAGSALTINPNKGEYVCMSYRDRDMEVSSIKDLSELSRFQNHHFFRVKCEANRPHDAVLMRALKQFLAP